MTRNFIRILEMRIQIFFYKVLLFFFFIFSSIQEKNHFYDKSVMSSILLKIWVYTENLVLCKKKLYMINIKIKMTVLLE